MESDDLQYTRELWNGRAQEWFKQVGLDGDVNRRYYSDPVLWRLLGPVDGLHVLDAGCGTGYLSLQLSERGAVVTGVDHAATMIDVSREVAPGAEFRVMSCSDLSAFGDATFDRVVSNYLLMDTPDLERTVREFHRVLKPGGHCVVVFSHPCFPQGTADVQDDGARISYEWAWSYFERTKVTEPPWKHFTTEFVWFHRPLSDYWRSFIDAGFRVESFEEPCLTAESAARAASDVAAARIQRNRNRPYSAAFRLDKEEQQK
jgi:ubiquinone/menaquinone biosynthesis C-methylase UbiE